MNILIIKLGAKGDVIRTLPIAKALKEKNPLAKITWLTKKNAESLLEHLPYIEKVETVPYEKKQIFDVLYNFDIEEEATTLAKKIPAKNKLGFYNQEGFVQAFNLGAEYYLNTLFDDETKKTNQKTYQEMMFDTADIEYKKQDAEIILTSEDKQYAKKFIQENNLSGKKIIGIHMGSAPRWPSKIWHEEKIISFIKKARKINYEIILFGGPDEIERQKNLFNTLNKQGTKLYNNNPKNTDRQFASLVNICDVMICSDSFALHVAVALRKPTIALFFCTPPNEVESYNLVKKIVSPLLKNFFPEKMDVYNEELTKSISEDEVLKAVGEIITKANK